MVYSTGGGGEGASEGIELSASGFLLGTLIFDGTLQEELQMSELALGGLLQVTLLTLAVVLLSLILMYAVVTSAEFALLLLIILLLSLTEDRGINRRGGEEDNCFRKNPSCSLLNGAKFLLVTAPSVTKLLATKTPFGSSLTNTLVVSSELNWVGLLGSDKDLTCTGMVVGPLQGMARVIPCTGMVVGPLHGMARVAPSLSSSEAAWVAGGGVGELWCVSCEIHAS